MRVAGVVLMVRGPRAFHEASSEYSVEVNFRLAIESAGPFSCMIGVVCGNFQN